MQKHFLIFFVHFFLNVLFLAGRHIKELDTLRAELCADHRRRWQIDNMPCGKSKCEWPVFGDHVEIECRL